MSISPIAEAIKIPDDKTSLLSALMRLSPNAPIDMITRLALKDAEFCERILDILFQNRRPPSITESIIHDSVRSLGLERVRCLFICHSISSAFSSVKLEDFDIGYFQTEYYPYRDRNSDYGLSFGISIPIFNSNKNQIAEKKLDEIELRNDFAAEQYQDSIKRVVEYEYLKSLLAQHRMLIEQIEDLELDKLSSNLRQIEDNNPLTFLDLEEGKLKLEELKLKSYSRVIDQYLEFLDAYNVITNLPLRNYLSKDLSNLE